MSLFKILMDAANEAFALSKVVLGTVIDGTINGLAAFGFRDSDGNATMPQLDSLGNIPVTFDIGTTLRNSDKLLEAGQTKNVEAEVVSVVLTADKIYSKPIAQVSNFRASLFRLVHIDDSGGTPVETEIGYSLVDAGNNNGTMNLVIDEFNTTGGTGVILLSVLHTPLDKVSDAYASVAVNEI